VLATPLDLEKAKAINALIDPPARLLPSALGDQMKPFAVGLFAELRSKPDVSATALRRAIAAFVHSKRYYLASAQPDAMRHDIEGVPIEPVSDVDRQLAQDRFVELRRKHSHAQDKLAVTPAVEPPTKTEQIRAALLARKR
jgi:sRNA-binding protein